MNDSETTLAPIVGGPHDGMTTALDERRKVLAWIPAKPVPNVTAGFIQSDVTGTIEEHHYIRETIRDENGVGGHFYRHSAVSTGQAIEMLIKGYGK